MESYEGSSFSPYKPERSQSDYSKHWSEKNVQLRNKRIFQSMIDHNRKYKMSARRKSELENPILREEYEILENHYVDLCTWLQSVLSISGQMELLLQLSELSPEDDRQRLNVGEQLSSVFSCFFPNCNIWPFGSSVSSFALTSSDFDVHLDLSKLPDQLTDSMKQFNWPYGECLAFLPRNQSPPFTSTDIANLNQLQIIQILHCIVKSFPDDIGRCECVLDNKTTNNPSVKFLHKTTNLICDFHVNSRLSITSTRWLKLYALADDRVRPLVATVRQWARMRGLVDNVDRFRPAGYRFSSYSLVLLVVFYLMRSSPAVVPTVHRLKELADDSDRIQLDGLDLTITHDVSKIRPSENRRKPEYLLGEFFHFYKSFDFSSHVIDLRRGVPRRQEINCSIYVEDPFTKENCCSNVSASFRNLFQTECQRAYDIVVGQRQQLKRDQLDSDQLPVGLCQLIELSDNNWFAVDLHDMGVNVDDGDGVVVKCLLSASPPKETTDQLQENNENRKTKEDQDLVVVVKKSRQQTDDSQTDDSQTERPAQPERTIEPARPTIRSCVVKPAAVSGHQPNSPTSGSHRTSSSPPASRSVQLNHGRLVVSRDNCSFPRRFHHRKRPFFKSS